MEKKKRREFLTAIRNKSNNDLLEDLKKSYRERFALIVQKNSNKEVKKGNACKVIRKNIARIKTIIGELKRSNG